jgi:hypothetical protein
VVLGSIDHSRVAGWKPQDVLALLQSAAADPTAAAFNGMQDADAVEAAAAAGLLPPILATDESLAGVWHEFDTSLEAAERQSATAEAARARAGAGAHHQQQQQQQGAGQVSTAAAAGSALVPGSGQAVRVSHHGIITWRPLLWFKFHSAEEAVAFVHRHRPLVEQHGTAATVRHRGPAPSRHGHVPAPAGGQQPQQLQQQQGVAMGVPVPPGFAAPMPGVVLGDEAVAGVPAAGPAAGAEAPPAPLAVPQIVPLPTSDEEEVIFEGVGEEEEDGSGGCDWAGSARMLRENAVCGLRRPSATRARKTRAMAPATRRPS